MTQPRNISEARFLHSGPLPVRLLMVEDHKEHAFLIREMLSQQNQMEIRLEHADSLGKALDYLAKHTVDMLLADLSLPDGKGVEIVQRLHAQVPSVPIIILTGTEDEQLAIDLVAEGAQDYLIKGKVNSDFLVHSIRYALERQRLLTELEINRQSFRNIVEKNTEGILVLNQQGIIQFVNPKAKFFLNQKDEELVGKTFEFSIRPGETLEVNIQKNTAARLIEIRTVETEWCGQTALLASLRDITERKKAEDHIRASLKEKDVLLKEVHHRVKNNLQIISSLLRLQRASIKDSGDLEVFKDSQNKIKAMALIHEILYQSENLAKINFADYLRKLASGLFHSYGVKPNSILLEIKAGEILLGVDAAIPCGLIVNELVSNSIKHAFLNRKNGKIWIEVSSDPASGAMTIIVRDNGTGFPKDLNIETTYSLGLRLVTTLTDQLGGTIEMQRDEGTEFKIVFPVVDGR